MIVKLSSSDLCLQAELYNRGLWKGGGGRVTGLTSHVQAWEGKRKALDMDRRVYGGEKGKILRHINHWVTLAVTEAETRGERGR